MKPIIFPNTEKIDFSKKLKVKFGIDPTSDKLHLGHLIPLLYVKKLWEEGHHVDIVLGNFTAQLGDPSGKDTMRPILTSEETEENANSISEQITRIFGNPDASHSNFENIAIHRNGDWFARMNAIMMTDLLSKFTTNQLLSRDSFQKRIEANNPIGMHELVIPILQGYDSFQLKTQVEIGGSDQLFNFAITRDVQRNFGQVPEICILMPIINGTDGRKMSKSFDNCIFINDSPNDVFGKTMSISDSLMQEWWPVFFDVEQINMQFPMGQKKKLAFKVTEHIWSFDKADEAQKNFEHVIQSKKTPDEMMEISLPESGMIDIVDVVKQLRNCSKNEAMRLLKAGAVTVEDGITKITGPLPLCAKGIVVKVGKRDFAKIV